MRSRHRGVVVVNEGGDGGRLLRVARPPSKLRICHATVADAASWSLSADKSVSRCHRRESRRATAVLCFVVVVVIIVVVVLGFYCSSQVQFVFFSPLFQECVSSA